MVILDDSNPDKGRFPELLGKMNSFFGGSQSMKLKRIIARILPPRFGMRLRHHFGDGREIEIQILKTLVWNSGACIDVGANRGTYAWPLSRIIQKNQELYLIETQENFVRYLHKAFSKNPRIIIVPKAASTKSGVGTIFKEVRFDGNLTGAVSFVNYYPNSQKHLVDTISIDDLDLKSCAFIKIDIDGHEYECLRGAEKTLREYNPILLVEIEYRLSKELALETAQFLLGLGYVAFEYSEGNLQPVDLEEFNDTNLNINKRGKFRNNFIFIFGEHKQKVLSNFN